MAADRLRPSRQAPVDTTGLLIFHPVAIMLWVNLARAGTSSQDCAMLILLILLSDLIGVGTILSGFIVVFRGEVDLGFGPPSTGHKAFGAALACVVLGFILIRFNHAMMDAFPEGLGH